MYPLIDKIRRGLKKPPRFILEKILYEGKAGLGKYWEPFLPHFITPSFLLRKFKEPSLNNLWATLAKHPFCCHFPKKNDPLATEAIFKKAEEALAHKVDLLGSSVIFLGDTIDWSRDYKSSFVWPLRHFRSISYADLDKPNDVKFPWELSRMQWMIPLGQAYVLTGDEQYAKKVKDLLIHWMETNPYAGSVNWACTMDVALRLIVWTWFFHVFKESLAWQDPAFREVFLQQLYLHGSFTSRHLEKSDINGNHYTADAAGLVFAGLFFGHEGWSTKGWAILQGEIKLQVFEDGVDFEASIPYHRLVQELFFFPALYRIKQGLDIPKCYANRLEKMAYFTACYSRLDGSTPVWGDADDARVLPFGDQPLNDHRYLIGLVGTLFPSSDLLPLWSGFNTEMGWTFEHAPPSRETPLKFPSSQDFPEGGFFIMRDDKNHVFIDCGPLGLAGRGGHGHNDCLSFEAVLENTPLITDCGAYIYTADYEQRNHFRSTSCHNTPQVDGQELNRFIRPDYLWNLHNDALPLLTSWTPGKDWDIFCGTHTGYDRLENPIRPIRTISLNHLDSELIIEDQFEGNGHHAFSIPLHLHHLVVPERKDNHSFLLKTSTEPFLLTWEGNVSWKVSVEPTHISPSYGVKIKSHKLLFWYEGKPDATLKVRLKKA